MLRNILILLFCPLILAAAQPKEAARQPANATDQNVAAALNNLSASLQESQKPNKHGEPCGPGHDKRSSDLCAQWKAADGAMSAARAAWWLGSIGALIGALTLAAASAAAYFAREAAKHTKAAADQAERQANLAERAIRETDRTNRAQLRTYLSSTAENFSQDETGTKLVLEYQVKNGGLTPAYDAMFVMSAYFLARGKARSQKARSLRSRQASLGLIGPGAENHIPNNFTISSAEAKAIQRGAGVLAANVEITYKDEFGDRWRFTQNMEVNQQSIKEGFLYTNSCATVPLNQAEVDGAEQELALEGGGEGRDQEHQQG